MVMLERGSGEERTKNKLLKLILKNSKINWKVRTYETIWEGQITAIKEETPMRYEATNFMYRAHSLPHSLVIVIC